MVISGELLIEIGVAEIPAAILPKLVKQLQKNLSDQLKTENISYQSIDVLYTPRRIALIAQDVVKELPSKTIERKGPALKIAFDENGEPTKACLGFARSVNAEVADLHRGEKHVSFSEKIPKQQTIKILPGIIQQILTKMPSIKGMRWGELNDEFIRPIYWLLAIFDQKTIPVETFGISTSNITYGHRVHSNTELVIKESNEYVSKLRENFVIVDQNERYQLIQAGIKEVEKLTGSICPENLELLEEVNNLVEYPVILKGEFDKQFLELPKEVLDTTIIYHQKCFPLEAKQGLSSPGFIIVSNIKPKDEKIVIRGNEKVMQARLSDAQFFYKNDITRTLDYYLNSLKNIQMHNKLGNLYDQSTRISKLIQKIVDPEYTSLAQRAGMLSKFDLATDMVGEFPELQGIVGYHYAKFYQENEEVAIAIKEQYMPNYADGSVPSSQLGCALAVSYRLDHLVGYFGVGIKPKGDHDPFALRRSALNVIKIILTSGLNLDLRKIIDETCNNYQIKILKNVDDVLLYILERLKGYYLEQGFESSIVDAVILLKFDNLIGIDQRIKALKNFLKNDFAKDLAASNKRVRRILLKTKKESFGSIDDSLLIEEAESQLYKEIQKIDHETEALVKECKFEQALLLCATLKNSINNFFDNTLVMAEDEKIRNNRMNLLFKLQGLFMRVADLAMINVEEDDK